MVPFNESVFKKMANALRLLSIDAVEQAASGHLGFPMGMADVATGLFTHSLKFSASDPQWFNRDRFILSAGHGSMLLYALLYLNGYKGVGLNDLKSFRQLGSMTPGHPEYGHTPGVEATTGPLGQGFANGVGLALAEEMMRAEFGGELVNHKTFVMAGDGCLMEGVTQEALSFAGHYGLSKLTVLFDDNHISIDGNTGLSTSEDTLARFRAANWDVFCTDGYDMESIKEALDKAEQSQKPSLIACRTIIGWGAPTKQGSEKIHGSPLGREEIARTREALDWPHDPFEVPEDLVALWRKNGQRGDEGKKAWEHTVNTLSPGKKAAFLNRLRAPLGGSEWKKELTLFKQEILKNSQSSMATRVSSGRVLDVLVKEIPALVGGSADLTESTNVKPAYMTSIRPGDFHGRFIHYGVREHALGAIMNGLTLHGGFIPYGSTFLVFSDYMRPAIRLSALMGVRVIYVLTHDSIALGKDGPTHQPVEHLASLRVIPNTYVYRPADSIETAECWECALETVDAPSIIALSRQAVPLCRNFGAENMSRWGAYIMREEINPLGLVIAATGSEVSLALEVRRILEEGGRGVRVISAPCLELYKNQTEAYKQTLFPKGIPLFSIEAGVREGLSAYLPPVREHFGVSGFGASGPGADVMAYFGLTADAIVGKIRGLLDDGPTQ